MMLRKKRQTNYTAAARQQDIEAAESDKLELVKAAAWAWHQHSSSSSSINKLSGRELRSRQKFLSHGPTRYRLESLSSTASSPVGEKTNTPLLDPYETERITRELEIRLDYKAVSEKITQGKKMVQKNSKKSKGGSLLGKHAVKICGLANDAVAEMEPLIVGRRHHESESDVLLQRRRLCKKLK